MMVTCRYFRLKNEKYMKDGHFISSGQKLLYICTEEKIMQFATADNSDIKRIFWATSEEVEFMEEIQEDWSQEKIQRQQDEVNGKWLIN